MSKNNDRSGSRDAQAATEDPAVSPYLRRVADDPEEGGFIKEAVSDEDVEAAFAAELPQGADPRPRKQTRRKPPKILTPRSPGFTGTPRDWDTVRIVVEEQARRAYPDWPEAAIQNEAMKQFDKLRELKHPKLPQEYLKLVQSSWCPERRHIRENIESYAMRQVPEAARLEALLRHADMGPSDETCDRRLPVSVFLRAAWQNGHPEFRRNYKDFGGSNLELDWAFFDTPDMQINTQYMRDETSARRSMKAMLERHDPLLLQALNLQVMERLAKRHDDIGTYLVVDGTPIHAFVEQDIGFTDEHREQIARGTGARLHTHGDGSPTRKRKRKHWVGFTLIVIADIKSGLPLVWELVHKGSEYPFVMKLMHRLFELAPWINPWVLVGDSEYDRGARLAFDLHDRLSVIPCFDLRQNVSDRYAWSRNNGVPTCPNHGAMKRVQDNDFAPDAVTIKYEEDYEKAKKAYKGHIRWRCIKCKEKRTANTWVRANARIYTYLPRKWTEHELYATRAALMLRRNSIEGINSQLKRRGIGARDHFKARWVDEPIHLQWLTASALFGMTLRREVHETTLYETAADIAWDLKLTKLRPEIPSKKRPPHPWQRQPRIAA